MLPLNNTKYLPSYTLKRELCFFHGTLLKKLNDEYIKYNNIYENVDSISVKTNINEMDIDPKFESMS